MKKVVLRNYSFWRQWLPFGSKEVPPSPVPPPPTRRSPAEEVRAVAGKFFPQHSESQLAEAVFPNVTIKTKVLLACEKATKKHIPNQMLGKLQTMDDVLSYFLSSTHNPKRCLVSQTKAKVQGPINLSVETRNSFVGKKGPRMAFQNFDDLKHAKFLSKKKRQMV